MASPTLTLGLIQTDILWENPNENIRRMDQLLEQDFQADVLLLPEMWTTGFTMQPEKYAETHPGSALEWMLSKAKQTNTAITGSIAVSDNHQYVNRWYCAFPNGQYAYYDKKHLFSYGDENNHYTPGVSTTVIEIKGWRIMPLICYDLRFPVWCRNRDNYDLLIIAANWPTPRVHHWDALIKARAIENQSYVAAVNRIGTDGAGLQYSGHSQVIDMNGEALCAPYTTEGIQYVTLEMENLTNFRQKYPFLKDMDAFRL